MVKDRQCLAESKLQLEKKASSTVAYPGNMRNCRRSKSDSLIQPWSEYDTLRETLQEEIVV